MLINEIWFDLKDGRKALLRSPKEEDIPGVLEYLYVSAGETEFIIRYPEECAKYTPEGERELFAQKNASENEALLICFVDGKVAGSCNVSFKTSIKTKHRAAIGIALLREYWNLGIGTRMLRELIRLAESREDVLQIELEFVEGNSRARHLYEKMGFRITGVHPNAIRLKDGTLLNEYLMICEVKH